MNPFDGFDTVLPTASDGERGKPISVEAEMLAALKDAAFTLRGYLGLHAVVLQSVNRAIERAEKAGVGLE